MSTKSKPQTAGVRTSRTTKAAARTPTTPHAAPRVIWPRDIETRWGVGYVTRWRMEKDGRLPPRDFFIGGIAVGWKPPTIERVERGETAAA